MSDLKRISPEIAEFQSDATELESQRPPFPARAALYLILLLLLSVLLWACLFKVDEIVVAPGKFIPSSNDIVMKPFETVVIKKVEVEVGQRVKEGQSLIVFNNSINQANVNRLTEHLDSIKEEVDRLTAEFNGGDYAPAQGGRHVQWQTALFAKRRSYCREKQAYYQENIKRLEAALNTVGRSVVKQQERLDSLNLLENMFEKLRDKQVASLKELVEIKVSRLQIEGDIDNQRNKLVEIEHELLSANAERKSFFEEWNKIVIEDLVKARRTMNETQEELEKAKRLSSLDRLKAPFDAIVLEIAQLSEGSAVREAEPLITLVPLNAEIEAEVNVLPKDIGRIKTGEEVRVKLDAYPFQEHGLLDGRIRIISGDTFQDSPQDGSAKQACYRCRVVVSGKLKNVSSNFRIIPGMQVTAEIKVGKRRIISYVLNPLIKAFDEALREP